MEKVSIIIPVFNSEKYISQCLESVINQTYKNIEIIIIIDGSLDNSEKIISRYANEDNRIIVFSKENEGQYLARIKGIKLSTAKYVMFLDADDWIELDSVEKLINSNKEHKADIVKATYIYEYGKIKRYLKKEKTEICVDKNNFKNTICKDFINTYNLNAMCAQIVKKDLFEDIIKLDKKKKILFAEDLLTNLDIYSKAKKILLLKDNIYHYRINEESITHCLDEDKIKNRLRSALEVYSKLFHYLRLWKIDNEENRKKVSLRILKEVSAQIEIILVNNIKNKENLIKPIIASKEMDNIKKIINEKDLKRYKGKYRDIMNCLYNQNIDILIKKIRIKYLILNDIKKKAKKIILWKKT